MSRLPAGQFIPRDSVLHRLNAGIKLLCLVTLLAAVIISDTVAGYAVITGMTAAAVALSGLPVKTALSSIRRMWLFLIVIFLMNALFFDGEQPIWQWWIFRPSVRGIAQGANVVLRVALLMALGNVLTGTTAPIEMTRALVRGMRPLRLLHIPVEDVAMIISVAIQFIPTLLEEADMIKKAQTARGARFESRRLSEKAVSIMPMAVPIFLSAFRKADELALAMEARGYRSGAKRVRKAAKPLRTGDYAALFISCAACVVEILLHV